MKYKMQRRYRQRPGNNFLYSQEKGVLRNGLNASFNLQQKFSSMEQIIYTFL